MPVVEMVLVDGSHTCFVARLNSGIVNTLNGSEPFPGASIEVKDHAFIWLWNEAPVEWRTAVFVKAFEWEHEPCTSSHKDAEGADTFACPDFIKDRFDMEAVNSVMKDCRIVPFNCKMENSGTWHWTSLHCEGVRRGFFIQSKETKESWQEVIRDCKKRATRSTDHECCKCQDGFDLKDYFLEPSPLSRVCRKDVFDQVSNCLGGNVDGHCWESLAPNHKRWSLYWFYSVNVFGQSKRKQLPKCFVQYVRHMYPDAVGNAYVGYKEKGEANL